MFIILFLYYIHYIYIRNKYDKYKYKHNNDTCNYFCDAAASEFWEKSLIPTQKKMLLYQLKKSCCFN